MAITYDESKYRKGIDTSYYDKAIEEYKNQQEKNRSSQISDAQKTQTAALKNAYIKRMQDENTLNQGLASSGIRGGMTETSKLKLANNYGNERGLANTNYSNSVNEINKNIDTNIADYQSDMNSRAEEYRQNLAQAKWNAAREDYNNALEYNLQKYETTISALADQYSRLSNSQLKKLIKTKGLNAAQKQALGRVRTQRGF